MEKLKELKNIIPELLITEAVAEPLKKEKNHKLLFSTNTDFLLQTAASMGLKKACLKEYENHLCVKLYKNKWDHLLKFKNITKLELSEIVGKLDKEYESTNKEGLK